MEPLQHPVYVTEPELPDYATFCAALQGIWQSKQLTNRGPEEQALTRELQEYLGAGHLSLFCNGTQGLVAALQALGIAEGEVITTPFTFVATAHSILANRCLPVFVDIAHGGGYGIDPDAVEMAITEHTRAILAVHVYGYPCALEQLAAIAKKYSLPLVYDAAHAFGVTVGGQPVASFGDASIFSFHATKLFHTCEGGAVAVRSAEQLRTLNNIKNFGFRSEVEVESYGINAKMNEMQALMGRLLLPGVGRAIQHRKELCLLYRRELADVPGICFPALPAENVAYNFAYAPVEIDERAFGMSRDGLYRKLKEYNIFTRRYFYPLVSSFPCYQEHVARRSSLQRAEHAARRILCLPLANTLPVETVRFIAAAIREIYGKKR